MLYSKIHELIKPGGAAEAHLLSKAVHHSRFLTLWRYSPEILTQTLLVTQSDGLILDLFAVVLGPDVYLFASVAFT